MALQCVDSFSLEDTGVLAFNSNFNFSSPRNIIIISPLSALKDNSKDRGT